MYLDWSATIEYGSRGHQGVAHTWPTFLEHLYVGQPAFAGRFNFSGYPAE
jgi:hypothetical protein